MHKLDKYAASCVKDKSTDIIKSSRSNYYRFNGFILRISDHIGSNSSGSISIIKTDDIDRYVLHRHSDGNLKVINYKEAKRVINGLTLISSVFMASETMSEAFSATQEITKNLNREIEDLRQIKNALETNKTVLGIPFSRFTKPQQNQINIFMQTVKK